MLLGRRDGFVEINPEIDKRSHDFWKSIDLDSAIDHIYGGGGMDSGFVCRGNLCEILGELFIAFRTLLEQAAPFRREFGVVVSAKEGREKGRGGRELWLDMTSCEGVKGIHALTLIGNGLDSSWSTIFAMMPIPVCLGGTDECCNQDRLL